MNIDFNRIKADALRNEALAKGANSQADLLAQIAALKAENEALRAPRQGKTITMKVSEKGALSVYGLGRFPVTLYQGQWQKLLAIKDEIEAFIKANATTLSTKD